MLHCDIPHQLVPRLTRNCSCYFEYRGSSPLHFLVSNLRKSGSKLQRHIVSQRKGLSARLRMLLMSAISQTTLLRIGNDAPQPVNTMYQIASESDHYKYIERTFDSSFNVHYTRSSHSGRSRWNFLSKSLITSNGSNCACSLLTLPNETFSNRSPE